MKTILLIIILCLLLGGCKAPSRDMSNRDHGKRETEVHINNNCDGGVCLPPEGY